MIFPSPAYRRMVKPRQGVQDYDLGSASIAGNLTGAGVVTAPQATDSFATRGSIVRLGLSHKIN
jgi:hypothetical protein